MGGWTKTILMLNSTQVEVEVGVACFILEVIPYFSGWVAGWLGGWVAGEMRIWPSHLLTKLNLKMSLAITAYELE